MVAQPDVFQRTAELARHYSKQNFEAASLELARTLSSEDALTLQKQEAQVESDEVLARTLMTEDAETVNIVRRKGQKLGLDFVEPSTKSCRNLFDKTQAKLRSVVIKRVWPGFLAAAHLNINPGDTLLAVNGAAVSTQQQAGKLINEAAETLSLRVQERRGAVTVWLEHVSGLALDEDLRITNCPSESDLEAACPFALGDTLIAVNGALVDDAKDARAKLAAACRSSRGSPTEPVALRVVRFGDDCEATEGLEPKVGAVVA